MATKPRQATPNGGTSAGEPAALTLVASSGISIRLWRLYAQAWLVCLVFPVLYLAQARLTPGRWWVAVGGLGVFVGLYTWLMWPHPLEPSSAGRGRYQAVLAALSALVLVLSLAYGSAFVWLFVGLSAAIGVGLPPRSAFVAVMVLTLFTLGFVIWLNGGLAQTDWLQTIPLVLLVRGLGLDMAGMARLSGALRELHAARSELARRAVTEERLRLARDLHDLLGHTLSLITLKSELAGRLIEHEPRRAAQEIREVERASRLALREVRQAVASYRVPTLAAALDGAQQLLEAAGISVTIEPLPWQAGQAEEAVLAWTVREGVTNVVRHSQARRCTIRLRAEPGAIFAEVINDGYRAPVEAAGDASSGLSGLEERVQSLGGRLEAGPMQNSGSDSFRLWVALPASERPAAMRESPP